MSQWGETQSSLCIRWSRLPKESLARLSEQAYDKHQPSMTAITFVNWVNTDSLPNNHILPSLSQSITPQIARKWLHNLGFCSISSKKGLYFDEHKQDDVVKYSKLFLCEIEILQSTHLPPSTCSTSQTEKNIGNESSEKWLVLIYQWGEIMPMGWRRQINNLFQKSSSRVMVYWRTPWVLTIKSWRTWIG